MFNRTVVVGGRMGPSTVRHTHVEKRAPTDESVKLLREMEGSAKEEVLKSVRVGNTEFECVVQAMFDAYSDTYKFKALFKLNGKPMEVEHETPERDVRGRDAEWPRELLDKMAEKIAAEILSPALAELSFHTHRI